MTKTRAKSSTLCLNQCSGTPTAPPYTLVQTRRRKKRIRLDIKLKNFIRERLPLFEPMTALTHGAPTERRRLKEIMETLALLPATEHRACSHTS
ncbi:hypothetical protein AK40_6161 (plasmid) [Bacillus cereus 03BB108]|uniref:Uncharacterized protein n=1 Tax=Bacillus cereus 03BB108 TaxID=451709 RepID=A0AAN0W4K6_BACCE|nr:hypothetical protein AK40_6161 [Bacillus cereus 03BB108]